MTTQWTTEDSNAAISQGWDLFDASDSENDTPFQLQAHNEADLLKNDDAAWALVANNAKSGEALALKALAFLKESSPNEYGFIAKMYPEVSA